MRYLGALLVACLITALLFWGGARIANRRPAVSRQRRDAQLQLEIATRERAAEMECLRLQQQVKGGEEREAGLRGQVESGEAREAGLRGQVESGAARDVILIKGREGGLVGKALNVIKALGHVAPLLKKYRVRVVMATEPVRLAVQDLVKEYGLDCEVLPHLPYRELLLCHGRSRLAISASDVDGTPSFLIEAMAMGCEARRRPNRGNSIRVEP